MRKAQRRLWITLAAGVVLVGAAARWRPRRPKPELSVTGELDALLNDLADV